MFSMEGLFDIHVHSGPEILERVGDDMDLAKGYLELGMAGFAVKGHFESTASRAHFVNKLMGSEHFRMVGGICLNYAVGGINPAAVDNCFKSGGRIVWGPSGHSVYHRQLRGGFGHWGGAVKPYDPEGAEGVTVLDETGELSREAKEVLRLVRENNGVYCTSHATPEEMLKLAAYCRDEKVKLIMTHIGWTPDYSLELGRRIKEYGHKVEICAVTFGGYNAKNTLSDCVRIIREIGPENIVMGTDAGAVRFVKPAEFMRFFAENLKKAGIAETDIRRMMSTNSFEALGIEM